MRHYKKCLRAQLGASFLTDTVGGPELVIREGKEAMEAIQEERRPHDPMCLVTSTGKELPGVSFSLLAYLVEPPIHDPYMTL